MKRKKGLIAIIAVIVMIALVFVGYHIYRYPATFRSLKDNPMCIWNPMVKSGEMNVRL